MHKVSKFNLLKVARCCCAGHNSLPSSHITSAEVVSSFEVVWMMAVVAEEVWLDHRLVDDSRDDRYARGV